jgi:hypothetical protein
VTALDGEGATVEYDDGSRCRLWRHGGFDERVTVGTALLACERWSLLSIAGSDARYQLSVDVRTPTWRSKDLPDDRKRKWTAGIVNLATGVGIDNLHRKD